MEIGKRLMVTSIKQKRIENSMKRLSLVITITLTIFIFSMSLFSGDASSELSSGVTLSIKNILDSIFINNNIELSTLHLVVRKMAHVVEYLILGVSYYFTGKYYGLSILKVLVLGLLTATVDELLQNIPADRAASIVDIFVFDFGGFIIGFMILVLLTNKPKEMEVDQALKLLSENKISTKKAYKYIYNQNYQYRFTDKAHFVKLKIIIPEEKGVNNFLRILFFFPFPIFIAKFGLRFVKLDSEDIPFTKGELLNMINQKGIKVQVNTSSKEKVIIKTI